MLIDTFLTQPGVKDAHQRHKQIKHNRVVHFYSKSIPLSFTRTKVNADGRRYLRGDEKVVELGDVRKQEIRNKAQAVIPLALVPVCDQKS